MEMLITISIDTDERKLYIGQENTSGCEYYISQNEDISLAITDYINKYCPNILNFQEHHKEFKTGNITTEQMSLFTNYVNTLITDSKKIIDVWREWACDCENYDSCHGERCEGEYTTAGQHLIIFKNELEKIQKKFGKGVAIKVLRVAEIPACLFPWEFLGAAEHFASGGTNEEIPIKEKNGELERMKEYVEYYKTIQLES